MVWAADMKALLAMILVVGLAGCSTVSGWFGDSGAAAGRKPAELGEIKPAVTMVRMWDASVGAGNAYVFSPATDGQAIYAASAEGRIVRLDPATGREIWRVDAGRTLSAGVGVGEGLVLVGTPKGELLAFRTENGQPAWTAKLTGEVLTEPVVASGVVAVRANDGKVWLLDAADGKQRWVYSRTLPALVLREPGNLLLTARALYAGHPGGKLTALALNNGAPIWEANVALPRGTNELERITDISGAIAADDRLVCVSAYQGRISCLDLAKGSPVWARDFSGLTGVEMDDRVLYAANAEAMLLAYDKVRGAGLWRQDKLRDRQLSTPLALGRHVATGDFQGYVHLLDRDTGAFAARAATDGSAIVGQMLPLEQGLVVQTANGGIHAFKIQ